MCISFSRMVLTIFTVLVAGLTFGQYPSGLHNEQLRVWLKANLYDGHHINLGYNLARQEMYSYTDEVNGQIECIYSGFKQAAVFSTFPDPINAEHLVPQSFFGSLEPMRSDIHVLRPTHGEVNTARGTLPFDEVPDAIATWYGIDELNGYVSISAQPSPDSFFSESGNGFFEPKEDRKGDIARQLFYFYTMYPTQAGNMNLIADVNLLYQWHVQDPVSSPELQRNDRIEEVQGNRNPFIDLPNLAYDAWVYVITCPMPAALDASQISAHEALISWQETGSASLWKLEYGITGFSQGNFEGTLVSVLDPFYQIQGLTSSTSYDFYVQSNCNPPDGDSDWAGPFTFTTLPDYCQGDVFTDSGMASGNYANNEDKIYVLCPDMPSNGGITLTFLSVDIAVNETALGSAGGCWDYLTIYNGADTNAVMIAASLCGELETDGQSPFITSSLLQAGDSFTSTDLSGCLTVRFRSDEIITEGGWTASVSCPENSCLAPTDLDVIEIGFGGPNPRVNATWNNQEGTSDCEVRGGRISPTTAGTSSPQFSNINNTQVIAQTNGSTVNFNIALYNNPNVPFQIGSTYGYEVRCTCDDGSGFSDWSGIYPNSTFIVPEPPVSPSMINNSTEKRKGDAAFYIYPNPSDGKLLFIQAPEEHMGKTEVIIQDLSARILKTETFNFGEDQRTMQLESGRGMRSGVYVITLISEKGIWTSQWVVE